MEYKNFTVADCEQAIAFWRKTPGIHMHENGEDSLEGIQSYIRRNEKYSFVVLHQGNIIGAIMCGHDGRRGLIHHFGVDAHFRRQGIATHLMTLALNALKEDGIKKCALFVLKENTEAMKFYEANQWSEENIVKIYAKII